MLVLNQNEVDTFQFMLAGFDNSLLTLSEAIATQLPHSLSNVQRELILNAVRSEIDNARDAISEFAPVNQPG